MKNILLIIVSCLVSSLTYGQWTNIAGTNNYFTPGKVGIGTSNPGSNLEITGTFLIGGSNLDERFPLSELDYLRNSGKMLIGWNRSAGGGETDFISNQGGGNIGFSFYNYSNNGIQSHLLAINASGAIGVGAKYPSAWFPGRVLEIRDKRPILRLSPEIEGGLATILLKGSYDERGGTADEFHINYVSSTAHPRIVFEAYQSDSGKPVMSILGTGNIGIGIEFPTEKLTVNGNIRAREIKVENDRWPDYVFKSEYSLLKLQEVESYIKDNGHLPGMPSAKLVQSEGVNLGEINAKLLEKIEELTLYLIEKDKEINNLQKLNMKILEMEERLKKAGM